MIKYLIQLPSEVIGQNILGYLELIDIMQWENAAANQQAQQLLKDILPYFSPLDNALFNTNHEIYELFKTDSQEKNKFERIHKFLAWCNKRRCRIKHCKLPVELWHEINLQHSVLNNIELCLNRRIYLEDIKPLNCTGIDHRITRVKIETDQHPAAIEVLFSLLSSVHSLDIQTANLFSWKETIRKIGPCLYELSILNCTVQNTLLYTITEYCPNLEKFGLRFIFTATGNILQRMAINCPHLRIFHVNDLNYHTSTECDADLTAFAEKCPQLEDLYIFCEELTDQSVIALAQHCSRLKKLQLDVHQITVTSLIALSERGLPLEELIIPEIPIPSAEIAAQCAHALSRIHRLCAHRLNSTTRHVGYAIQYMTELRELQLDDIYDHRQFSHIPVLLQGYCGSLESFYFHQISRITSTQLIKLAESSPKLHTLSIHYHVSLSSRMLVKFARSCPGLQNISLYSEDWTAESVLVLARNCKQLRELYIPNILVNVETVRKISIYCRRLTMLSVSVNVREGEVIVERYQRYYKKEIRAMREIESNHTEVITHHSSSSSSTCLIM